MKKYNHDYMLRWLFSVDLVVVLIVGATCLFLESNLNIPNILGDCANDWFFPGLRVACKKTSQSNLIIAWTLLMPLIFLLLSKEWILAIGNSEFRRQIVVNHQSFNKWQRFSIVYIAIPVYFIISWCLFIMSIFNQAFAKSMFGDRQISDFSYVLGSVLIIQLFWASQFSALEKFRIRNLIMKD